jgi:Fungalysin metallopeptidase (M36)
MLISGFRDISSRGGQTEGMRISIAATGLLVSSAVTVATLGGGGLAAAGSYNHEAAATVFNPNPVQQTGKQWLTDRKDADYPALQSSYQRVTLTDLDDSGELSGRYVVVKSSTGKPARLVNGSFPAWHRDADQFEQVMGYYWVTQAQHYLQSLGFGSSLPAVNQRQIVLRINQLGYDNSFFRSDKGSLRLGKGGVDDAEDAEVIVHEYGHAVQNAQVPGFGSTIEAGAIGEGFSDYLAVSVTSWATGVPKKTNEACVADWDAVSYTRGPEHCLRKIDGDKVYPQDAVGQVHADGEIWSAALYDIHQSIGANDAARIIIGAQFSFKADTTFAQAARATVNYANSYGMADEVRAAFQAHGLL